jgi:crossover junction endodeoxyribonuclease RuvC
MDVCGIDPGLDTTGYAMIRVTGEHTSILDAGVLRTKAGSPLPQRLVQLDDDFSEVLVQWRPAVVGVEQLSAHYKHPRTAIQMGHARGVLLAAAQRRGAQIMSFNATRIKRYVTGNGRASKTQVQQAIQSIFDLDALPEPNDVADAIAAAYCCASEMAVNQLEIPT